MGSARDRPTSRELSFSAVVSVPPCRADVENIRRGPPQNTNPQVRRPWSRRSAARSAASATRRRPATCAHDAAGRPAVQEVGRRQHLLGVGQLDVVERGPALADRPAGGVARVDQARRPRGRRSPTCPPPPLPRAARAVASREGAARRAPRRRPCRTAPRTPPAPPPSPPAPCTRVVTSAARAFCASRQERLLGHLTARARRSRSRRAVGEDLEQRDHRGVLDVDPVLVEGVGAGHLGRQPDGVALALAELGAGRVGEQRRREQVDRRRPRPGGSGRTPAVRLPHWSCPPVCSVQP